MSRYVGMATWDDVPHLSARQKAELLASIPLYQRDARSKGIPQLGSGAIYPVPESDILCDPIEFPVWWPRAYGLDVGWNRTAAIWGCRDPDADIVYLYSEYYRSLAEPAVHVTSINARGKWIPGVIDPASRGRSQHDGHQLLQSYIDLGLDLAMADNAVETGLFEVYQRLSTGRLKVFRTLTNFLMEYRLYRRDERGHVVKTFDHLMDASRYLVMSGVARMVIDPGAIEQFSQQKRGEPRMYDPHTFGVG